MDEYDIVKAFQEMEEYLIKSMSSNLARHLADQDKEELDWTMWQVEQLKALEQFRKDNQELFKGYYSTINEEIDIMIQKCYNNANSEQEKEILEAIRNGFEVHDKSDKLEGTFFNTDNKKLMSLIKSVNDDMQKAESSILRMANDQYRQIIYNAQVFYNTGTLTTTQAIDMATKDFLSKGINSIEYKNGARVPIDSYVEMALRTANKRANIMGSANKRDEWGIHTVIVPPRGTGCPFCVPYQGRILIDDVFGSGSSKDGKYPLLSTAMNNGFMHPNCKDTISTYFEGVNTKPKKPTLEQQQEKIRVYNLQQKQRYNERQIRKYTRLELGSVDKDNIEKYKNKRILWTNANDNLIASSKGLLRKDTSRYSIRGISALDKLAPKVENKVKVKTSSFKKAESISEVQNRISTSLGKTVVDLRGTDIKMANEYLRAVEDFTKDHPQLKNFLDTFDNNARSGAGGSFQLFDSKGDVKATLKMTNENYDSFMEKMKYNINKNFHFDGNDAYTSTIHELTHAMDCLCDNKRMYKYDNGFAGTINDGGDRIAQNFQSFLSENTMFGDSIIKQAKREMFGTVIYDDIKDDISYLGDYATYSDSEMLAQCMAYEYSGQTNKFSARVKELFEEQIKELFE